MTTEMIEARAARARVLYYYRRLRRAGLSPADTMAQLRDAYAHQIALAVYHGAAPPADTVAYWAAAHQYAMSMARRPTWWFKAR